MTVKPDAWLSLAKEQDGAAIAEKIKAKRDALLDKSDKTQIPDADVSDECRDAYKAYRQTLRKVTEQPGFPFEVE